MMIEEDVSWV